MTHDVMEDDHLKSMQNIFGIPLLEVLKPLQHKLTFILDQEFAKRILLGEERQHLDNSL